MKRSTVNEKLKADTLARCRRELGHDTPFWGIGDKSLRETEARAEASKAVSEINKTLAKLESAQLDAWVAVGGSADGTFYHDEDDAPPDYLSNLDTPAHRAARTLRVAVDAAKNILAESGSGLKEYVAQFNPNDHDVTWRGCAMHVKGLTDREVAMRALLQGYWPNSRKLPLELGPDDVIETVRKAVHGYRK